MAVSIAQSTASSFVWYPSSITTSNFGSSVSSGNTIIALIVCGNGALSVQSVTDTGGNSYSLIASAVDTSGSGVDLEIWAADVTTGGSGFSVTANDSGNDLWWVSAYEVSGLVSTSLLDASTHTFSSGSAPTTTFSTATSNNPDCLLQLNMAIGVSSSDAYSLSSGWSNLHSAGDYTDGGGLGFIAGSQARAVSTTGTFPTAIGFSGTASTLFDAIMVAVKGTAAGSTPTNNFFF